MWAGVAGGCSPRCRCRADPGFIYYSLTGCRVLLGAGQCWCCLQDALLTTFHHCSVARCGSGNSTFNFTSTIRAEEAASRRVVGGRYWAGMERWRYSANLRHFYCFDAFLRDAAAAYLQTTPVVGPESCCADNLTPAFPGPGEREVGG